MRLSKFLKLRCEVFGKVHMLRQLEKLDVLGGRDIPEKSSGSSLAPDSFNQSGASHAEVLDLDGRVFIFECFDNPRDDRPASQRAVPNHFPFLLGVFCAGRIGLCPSEYGQGESQRKSAKKNTAYGYLHRFLLPGIELKGSRFFPVRSYQLPVAISVLFVAVLARLQG